MNAIVSTPIPKNCNHKMGIELVRGDADQEQRVSIKIGEGARLNEVRNYQESSKPVQLLLRRGELVPKPIHVVVQLVEHLDLLLNLRVDGKSEVFLTL